MNLLSKLITDYRTLLHNNVSDYEIFNHFIGGSFKIGKGSNCPYRVDMDPSLTVFQPTKIRMDRPDALLFKDMATGVKGDVIKFVKKVANYQYGYNLKNIRDVVTFLNREMQLELFKNDFMGREKLTYNIVSEPKEIKIVSRPFTIYDRKFWSALNVFEDLLSEYNVKSIKYLLDPETNHILRTFRSTQLVYAYLIWDKLKLYQPLADKEFKFRNNCPSNDIRYYQGYKQLKGFDTLILTKSMKDVLTIVSHGLQVDALAPHSETAEITDKAIEILSTSYKKIIVLYDFDLAGVKLVNNIRKRTDWIIEWVDTKRVMVNNRMKVINKDISDLTINKGIKQARNFLIDIIK